jgi:hypothetical protein
MISPMTLLPEAPRPHSYLDYQPGDNPCLSNSEQPEGIFWQKIFSSYLSQLQRF